MILFLQQDNLRDIQTHLIPSLTELSIGDWNKPNLEIRSSGSYNIFRKSLLDFIRPSASKIYNINDTIDIKFITRLR